MDHSQDNWFQVSVKGLFFDEQGKLMMIQDKTGRWDIPGGRIQTGEGLIECLKRECQEELGLEVTVSDDKPVFVYPTLDLEGRGRVMVFFKVTFSRLDFQSTDECVAIKFFHQTEMRTLDVYPQLKKLFDLL